jgi:putative phosphoribosyl transferase
MVRPEENAGLNRPEATSYRAGRIMIVNSAQPYFQDREDAGQRLAENLIHYEADEAIVFAIPRGGIPVAIEVAKKLGCPLDLVIPRKIPIPSDPEAGYGAVTEDGAIVLNEPLVQRLNLTQWEIERHAEKVRAEIRRRGSLYRATLKPFPVEGKIAVAVDDGLASGYTMMAAVQSLRRRGASRVVVAVPVASSSAWNLTKSVADQVVCLIIAYTYRFAVAGFYRYWHDLTDHEAIEDLKKFSEGDRGRPDEPRGDALGKA